MLQDNYTPTKNLGNGTTVIFSFGFALLAEADIRVYLEDVSTGVQTLQTRGSDYDVTTWGRTGGTITFDTAPSDSYYVVIARDIAMTQEVNYETSSGFQGEVVEGDADKAIALIQDVAEKVGRALLYPLGADSGMTRTLPVVSTSAGYIYYDGSAYSLIDALTGTGDYPADITRGTDVSKSASPSAGDIHIATDTQKMYICFTAGTWTDYNQEIIDRNVLQIMDIAQTDYSGGNRGIGATAQYQSITPNRDMYVSSFSAYRNLGGGVATIAVAIETDNSDAPSGSLVSGSSEATGLSVGAGVAWNDWDLGQIIYLQAGTKYWIRIRETSVMVSPQFARSSTEVMVGEEWINTLGVRSSLALAFKLNTGTVFSAGDCVGVVANSFEKAQADSEDNSKNFIGIVKSVTSVSYYSLIDIVMSGVVTGQSSLVEGSLYYLDPATAGAYTATKPTLVGNIVKPVMIALSETVGLVINQVGIEVVASTTDMVFWENSAVGYENEVVYNQ